MREMLRAFLSDLPDIVRWWVVLAVPIGLVLFLLLGNWDIAGAAAATARVIGYGLGLLGFLWVHPLSGYGVFSWKRFGFAWLWFVVTALPAIALGTLLGAVVEALFTALAS